MCGDRECVTGDHLTIDVLRYPSSVSSRPGDPDGASTPPFFPLDQLLTKPVLRSLLILRLRTTGGLEQRHPFSSAASPVARPASALAWNPTAELPGARARSRRLHPGDHWYCTADPAVLLVAPDHCGPPGPVSAPSPPCNNLGFGTPPPHRPANCNWVLLPGSSSLPGPTVFLATRETIPTPTPNVYSGEHRFWSVGREGSLPGRSKAGPCRQAASSGWSASAGPAGPVHLRGHRRCSPCRPPRDGSCRLPGAGRGGMAVRRTPAAHRRGAFEDPQCDDARNWYGGGEQSEVVHERLLG